MNASPDSRIAALERGDLRLSAASSDELWVRHEDQLMLDLRLEQLLVEAAAVLERADIPYRALKGPVLAHTVYADPSFRSFGDVDVLVPDDMFDQAVATLRELGFERRFLEPRRGFDARFSKGCVERGDDLELDLHRTLRARGVRREDWQVSGSSRAGHSASTSRGR